MSEGPFFVLTEAPAVHPLPNLRATGFAGAEDAPWWDEGPLAGRVPAPMTFWTPELDVVGDLPLNTLAAPVWSRRLLEAVTGGGPAPLEIVPVSILDDPEPRRVRDDFVLARVPTLTRGAMRPDRSRFRKMRPSAQAWLAVDGFDLDPAACPPGPVFRLRELLTFHVLDAAAARRVLDARLVGVTAVPCEAFRWGEVG